MDVPQRATAADANHRPSGAVARTRIEFVRRFMAAVGTDALLVPSADPHLSEYLPERWQGRQWLSGFTGSQGTLVVSAHKAALFADSRYWVQAETELAGSGIELVKVPTAASTLHLEWLARELPKGSTVAVDGNVLGLGAATALRAALDAAGITLRTDADLLDAVWRDRPGLPTATVFEHEPPHAVRTRAANLAAIREAMTKHQATHHLVSSVDDIAWITNLRGADVTYNPVFLAHLLISQTAASLFVGEGKVPAPLAARLAADGITLAPYEQLAAALAELDAGCSLLVDPRRVAYGVCGRAGEGCVVKEAINPSTLMKSRKLPEEAAHFREAMAEDGAAMCEFYAWLEAAFARGERITELTLDERLSAARARRPGFKGLSFATIAGFNANGALPHNRATEERHAVIEGSGLLLIDSGGQYLGGTTDITRTWAIGTPSAAMVRDYTLVLKGTMQLSRARFPSGTLSPMLDALARAPLWEHGIDYGHGTGHGVGYFLAVHEGPQNIGKTVPEAHMAMESGMVTSVEPGVYRPGKWGARIENLVLAVTADTGTAGEFGEFLEFETLTLCPIDTRCIELSLLREDEIAWLNGYHATVRERLAPRLAGAALAWLIERTAPL
jgi:Xaa-Pro aminopeptidase